MEDCIFCLETSKIKNIILYQNENVYVRIDNFPVAFGHVEILPIRHFPSVKDLPKEVWSDLYDGIVNAKIALNNRDKIMEYYKELSLNPVSDESANFLKKAIESKFAHKKIDGYTIGFNDGIAAGQSIMHCHLHLIPRFEGDVAQASGGIRGIFGEANY
jgi:diadenosine tetraphosphate (Ap4A) HIT family hydrolase